MTELDHFKIICCEAAESGIEYVVIPARVVRPCDVHIRAIVGNNESILLHRSKYLLHVWITRPLRNVNTRLQT